MTMNELMNRAWVYAEENKQQRMGQAHFNCVNMHFPEIANALRGTAADPFYNDGRLVLFWEHVDRLMNERTNLV